MSLPGSDPDKMFGTRTATAIVVANMIGTGVFTSLGFQLLDLRSPFVLLMLWVVGGITALCGALTYAELGAALPRSGGEYNFLSRLYHPGAGFISGWISLTVGFSAPTALAAMTFGKYLQAVFPVIPDKLSAVTLVVLLTAAHTRTHRTSGGVQRLFTALKVLLIVAFCGLCWIWVDVPQDVSFAPASGDEKLLLSGVFAVALIYVNYAYTGWNCATYLIDELKDPNQALPLSLAAGTLIVMVLYLLLNFTFLYVAPMDAMAGKVEIGYVAAQHSFGTIGSGIMGMTLTLLLISTVSAMIIAGPRVLQVMGQDFKVFRALARTNADEVPVLAIVLLSALTLVFIITGSFQRILVLAGFTLGLNTLFTVAGIFLLRMRGLQDPALFRMPFYPLPPLVFLALTGWTLTYILINKPIEALFGLGVVVVGAIVYFASDYASKAATLDP